MSVVLRFCLVLVLMSACALLNPATYARNTATQVATDRPSTTATLSSAEVEQTQDGQTAQLMATSTSDPNKQLIFAEEFNGDQLDETYWHTEYSWGRKNPPEAQYYAPDAFEVRDGILRIKAEKRVMKGQKYTSGIIASFDRFKFTYGYVEMRAKLPAGQGLWPAFWLLLNDDNKTGEIDIFEMLGKEPNILYMSTHFPDSNGESVADTNNFEGPDFSKGFHTFAVDWRPDTITWYIDGVQRNQISHDIPNEPMYILANLAVGGTWGGYPDSTTRFPAYYDIDYIRVWQWK